MEEDKKVATEETSVLPLPSGQDATATTAATPAEPVPDSSKKEDVSVEKETKAPESAPVATDAASAAATTAAAPAPSTDAAAPAASTAETQTAPASSLSRSSSSRRSSGVSGIANRVHRETRAGAESRLPSRYSDFEVSSPRQTSQGRVTRQKSSDKKNTPPPTATEQQPEQAPASAPAPAAAPADAVPQAPADAAKTEKEVDPADELEMMLMNRGALPVQPPAKKAREDPVIANATPAVVVPGTPADAKKSGGDKSATSTAKKSKSSKRKSLVEGREARVVKRKFSLEQEMGLPDELQKCLALLNNMFRQDDCAPFYYAVDPVRLNIPDYWDVIKHPMDMTTIKEKLIGGSYKDAKEFAADVHLMFENARTYNPVGHVIHTLADRLEKSFEEQMNKIHTRRASSVQSTAVATNSSSQLVGKVAPRLSSSSSKKSRPSQAHAADESDSSASSSSSGSSDSDSSEYSDDGHRKHKGKHHSKHHHHHHHHKKSDKARAKKRSRSSSSTASELASVEESIRRAELEKLQKEVLLLKSQLLEQKQNKAKAASAARAEKAAMAAAKRASKSTPRRPPLSFDSAPDPDRPVTEEDKRRISGNINRLPPERMLPLVSFVQDQIPTLSLVMPGRIPMMPSEIEVDLDTLDNRTLRTVDHKVRQALALAGQARRRAERRLLEMQMHKEQQQRHHVGISADQQRAIQAKSLYQTQILTPQQTAMKLMNSLSQNAIQRDMSPLSPSGSRGFGAHEGSLPGTPGSGQSGAGGDMLSHTNSEMEDDDNIDAPEEEVGENGVVPNLGSDSESSSSSSSSSESEADDDMPGSFVPPPLVPGSASGPVSLSQATSISSAAAASSSTNPT